jgi:hypothetical protein
MAKNDGTRTVDVMTDVYRNPQHLLQDQLQNTYFFAVTHGPAEDRTEDDPPVEPREDAEIIPIDECLGHYSPDRQRITIFQKGIRQVSNIFQVDSLHLEYIVRMHELAHALFHLGVTQDDNQRIWKEGSYWTSFLRDSTSVYMEIESGLHERLAQILTLHCVQDLKKNARTDEGKKILERIEGTFHRLASCQPPEYQIRDLVDVPRSRICKSVSLLRSRSLVGQVDPWKTILLW